MSWWAEAAQHPKPEPPLSAHHRYSDTLQQFRRVENELSRLDHEIRLFRKTHSIATNLFQQIICAQGATMGAQTMIVQEWATLRRRVDALMPVRNRLLGELARMKSEKS